MATKKGNVVSLRLQPAKTSAHADNCDLVPSD
jgi:hypothetical protein